MLFVWNGISASPLLQSLTLAKAFEFEKYIAKTEGPFLEVLFSGGVFSNEKLKTGAIWEVSWSQKTMRYKE